MKKILLFLLCCLAAPVWADNSHMVVKQIRGDYKDVKDSLVFAINGQGLVVNAESHVGDMLERTGRDLGATRKIYDKAEAVEFCSAGLSRKMMEADPDNIVFCPYTIYLYARPEQPGMVSVAYRRPVTGQAQQSDVLKEVEKLYQDIISEVVQ